MPLPSRLGRILSGTHGRLVGRATPDKRVWLAIFAMLLWIAVLATKVPPSGADWLFWVAAPFYFGFFVQQIRGALKDRSN